VALTHLLDTSALTRIQRPAVLEAVEPLVALGAVGRARITDLELGASARNDKEWDQLMEGLKALPRVLTTTKHVERALQVQRQLASASQRGREIPALLVAAAAEELGLTVLHYDADFDLISQMTGQLCEWVVPKGSID